ncbi:MAG: glycosyltransferase [Limnohabitans sp.]
MKNIRPSVLFISPCTPDKTGVGWEQRAFSILLAYSKYLDVNLWFVPTEDNPVVERVKKIDNLCKSITVFNPAVLVNTPELIAKFHDVVKLSSCIHIYRQIWLISNIQHKCIFWDMDELPIELRDGTRNLYMKPIPLESINNAISHCTQASNAARRVFSSSHLEVHAAIRNNYYMPNVYSADVVSRARKSSHNLIFVGNMNFFPNVHAVFYFSENILPLLPKSAHFTIVGRSPVDVNLKEKFNKLIQSNDQIKFFYDVESCTPFYHDSSVAVAPIYFGGGTKLKILEAFSHFCPVVSTSKGCEGLEVSDGTDVLLGDTPEEFAKACQFLMENPQIGDSIAKNARNLLFSKYSQNHLNDLLYSCLREEGVLQNYPPTAAG